MGAGKRGINKMVRKKKVQNKAADWKSRLLGRDGGGKEGEPSLNGKSTFMASTKPSKP